MTWLPSKTIAYGCGELPNLITWEWGPFILEYPSKATHWVNKPGKPSLNKKGFWRRKETKAPREPKPKECASVPSTIQSVKERPKFCCDLGWAWHMHELGCKSYVAPILDLHQSMRCSHPQWHEAKGKTYLIEPDKSKPQTTYYILLGGPQLHEKKFPNILAARKFLDTYEPQTNSY